MEWARARWAGFEVLSSCYLVGPDANRATEGGFKLELDGLVLSDRAEVVAVIEAKAGTSLYDDIPKLLAARDRWMQPCARVKVRIGRSKDGARSLMVGAERPLVVYVMGGSVGRGPTSFVDLLSRSAFICERQRMLETELRCWRVAGSSHGSHIADKTVADVARLSHPRR